MRKHLAWALALAVLAGFLGTADRVEADRVLAVRWNSGDHDIYQTSDNTYALPSSSEDPAPVRRSLHASPPSDSPRSDPVETLVVLYLTWFGGLLTP